MPMLAAPQAAARLWTA